MYCGINIYHLLLFNYGHSLFYLIIDFCITHHFNLILEGNINYPLLQNNRNNQISYLFYKKVVLYYKYILTALNSYRSYLGLLISIS